MRGVRERGFPSVKRIEERREYRHERAAGYPEHNAGYKKIIIIVL